MSDQGTGGAGGSSAGYPAAHSSGGMDASASQSMEAPDAMIGAVLDDRYEITAKLGEGGMGEVYAAEHVHIEKRVAIKLLRAEIVANEEAVRRFRQEARSASSIGHKNIISIEDFGTLADGRIYLCMELLDGQPLNDMLDESLSADRLLNILIQTGHGLAAAHAKGIVHRDMKPENVFVTTGDVPKLLDFGIAKVSQAEGSNHLTRTGTIFGTPFYMAPEQALGQTVDHRADIYAMGVILYECFCGHVPFQGDSFMGILTQHITAEPVPPAQAAAAQGRALPPGLEAVIIRAMKKEPNERYGTMDEFVQALVVCYRGMAGAGMSGYMAAHVPVGSAGFSSATPIPGMPSTTPMPGMPSTTPMPGMSAPVPVPMSGSGPMYGGDSAAWEVPKKSGKGGLIAAIIIVLLVLGGGTAFVVMSGGDKKADASGNVGNTDGTGTTDGTDPAGTAGTNGTTATNGTAENGTVENGAGENGAGENGGVKVAGTNGTAPDTAGTNDNPNGLGDTKGTTPDGTGDTKGAGEPDRTGPGAVALQPIAVIINSKPPGASVYQGDVRLGTTPYLAKVLPGEPMEVVIKRSRYKDESVVVDGSKQRVDVSLDRVRTASTSSTKGGKGGKGGKGTKGDKGGKGSGTTLEPGVLGDPASELE